MTVTGVTVTGRPDGPTVILAHGFGCEPNMCCPRGRTGPTKRSASASARDALRLRRGIGSGTPRWKDMPPTSRDHRRTGSDRCGVRRRLHERDGWRARHGPSVAPLLSEASFSRPEPDCRPPPAALVGCADPPVVPDGGVQGEEALDDAGEQPVGLAGSGVSDPELAFEALDDGLDPLIFVESISRTTSNEASVCAAGTSSPSASAC